MRRPGALPPKLGVEVSGRCRGAAPQQRHELAVGALCWPRGGTLARLVGREVRGRHVEVHVVREDASLERRVHRGARGEQVTDRGDGARAEGLERAAPERGLAQPPPALVVVMIGVVGVGVGVVLLELVHLLRPLSLPIALSDKVSL